METVPPGRTRGGWLRRGEGLGQMPRDRGLRGHLGPPGPPHTLPTALFELQNRSSFLGCPDGLTGLGSDDFWGRRWEGGEGLPV